MMSGGGMPGMPSAGGMPGGGMPAPQRMPSILDLVLMMSEMDGPQGAPPAPDNAIASLPEIVVDPNDETQGLAGESCPVCMDSFAAGHRVHQLPCGHSFHIGCVDRWLRMHNSCPTCR